jgi:hypothetical protein
LPSVTFTEIIFTTSKVLNQHQHLQHQHLPKPVITSRGFCYAINAKQMSDVFANNQYIETFQEVFGKESRIELSSGNDYMQLKIDLNLSHLTDRSASKGSIW